MSHLTINIQNRTISQEIAKSDNIMRDFAKSQNARKYILPVLEMISGRCGSFRGQLPKKSWKSRFRRNVNVNGPPTLHQNSGSQTQIWILNSDVRNWITQSSIIKYSQASAMVGISSIDENSGLRQQIYLIKWMLRLAPGRPAITL